MADSEFRHQHIAFAVMTVLFVLAPAVIYPLFLMKAMCFALFACAFNLLIGFTGLLSFGHAAFLGGAAYATGGLSLLGESLLASGTGGGECEAALGKVAPANAAKAGPPPDRAKAPADDLAKSLGRLFHR